jgi:hypothetical protein
VLLQRKKTLLVEYKSLRKANTFIDRRFGGGLPVLDVRTAYARAVRPFGQTQLPMSVLVRCAEEDERLTEEDKSFARLQRQRVQDMRRGAGGREGCCFWRLVMPMLHVGL